MKKFILRFLFVFLITAPFSSCELINPAEKTPSYIAIDTFTVQSNYTTQGTTSHKIRDAWVYVDNELIGAYELPAKFPVLKEGSHSISIGPGIFDNGIASTRLTYPFYRFYSGTIELKAGEVTKIDTVPVAYFPAISYTWYEDLENSGYSLDTLAESKAELAIDTTDAYEGNRCLKMEVTTAKNVLVCASVNAYSITPGVECYLELNYKCDQPFVMGLIANYPGSTVQSGVILLNASTSWNKIYISLKRKVGEYFSASNYNVFFRVDLADGLSQGTVYLDNIKLIHN